MGTNGIVNGTPPSVETPPEGWVKLADLAKDLGRSPRTVRKWATGRLDAEALVYVEDPQGRTPTLYTAPTGARSIRQHYREAAEGSGPTEGPALDPEEGWREALRRSEAERDRLQAERDRAVEEVRGLQVTLRETERGKVAAERTLDRTRTSWAMWWGSTASLSPWRRWRLPSPPPELTEGVLLLEGPKGE